MKNCYQETEIIEMSKSFTPNDTLIIGYYSEPKCLKAYQNYTVKKYTEMYGKIGLNYSDLPSVKERLNDPNYVAKPKNTDTEWLVDKKVQKNNKTGSKLLFFYPMPQPVVSSKIILIDNCGNEKEISKDEIKIYCGSAGQSKPQLNEDGTPKYPEIIQIRISNIYKYEKVSE